jgi:hypothetical protein
MVTLDRKFFSSEVLSLENGHFAAIFYPMLSIFHGVFFLPDSPLVREITSLSKQYFRGPDQFFFEFRSEPHKLEQAMPLAVKKRKTSVPARPGISAFSLDGATSPYPFD